MQRFSQLFEAASASVPAEYFQLPIDGQEDPIYRERVYCYELYHQLRAIWPKTSRFSLAGEVDKSGHPLIRGNGLDNCKPDFLVHIPGDMGGNFAIIEVKPIRAQAAAIQKDIEILSSFVIYAQYERAMYLFYGRPSDGNGIEMAQDAMQNSNLSEIEIWHHVAPGEPARRLR
jgi:hypothetical protein